MVEHREQVRVLVVDDSAFIRRATERMLAESPEIRIVGTATNGREAVDLACRLRPDVIVLDVNMPTMDGLEALGQIMATCPAPVLMMSTMTQDGAEITVRALELGAVDFVDKTSAGTSMDIYSLGPILREKVFAVAGADVAPPPTARAPARPRAAVVPPAPVRPGLTIVTIGASTGGPRALTEIIPRLPGDLPAAVLVAQHMPSGFTATLASRLDERSALKVVEASDGDAVESGRVLIAPGGRQMRVAMEGNGLRVRVRPGTSQLLHHPSVDVLFDSVAAVVGARAIGIVLTGMGHDGAEGLAALRRAGAITMVESPSTAIIDGMPKAARASADHVVDLPRIADAIVDLCTALPAAEEEGA